MSNETNETIADIINEKRTTAQEIRSGTPNQYGIELAVMLEADADRIEAAYKREKAKPVRNCDKYRTAADAYDGFIEFCRKYTCGKFIFINKGTPVGYAIEWLYGYASKDEAK